MIAPQTYKDIAARWISGVAIVTAPGNPAPVGTTVSAVLPLSLDPPLFAVSFDRRSSTLAAIRAAGCFAINILAEGQHDLCARFARAEGDRFAGVAHHTGGNRAPLLDGAAAHVECTLDAEHTAGDHILLIGRATAGGTTGIAPLGYCERQFWSLAKCA